MTVVATSPTLGDIATVCSRKSHKYTSKCITVGRVSVGGGIHDIAHRLCSPESHKMKGSVHSLYSLTLHGIFLVYIQSAINSSS